MPTTPLNLPDVAWSALAPMLILIAGSVVVLMAGTFLRHRDVGNLYSLITFAAAAGSLAATVGLWSEVTGPEGTPRFAVAGAIAVDGFAVLLSGVIASAVLLGALLCGPYLRREGLDAVAFNALMLLSASGGVLMAGANDLIVVFLGLEILSIALYVMAGYQRRQARSREAALKYFVLGSFSSAFFLYGVALTYGATGSTNLAEIAFFLQNQIVPPGVLGAGMGLLLVGLGFKVAAVPFHMWTPDVYEGSPSPVTGFMAAAAKTAGFAALLRVFGGAFITQQMDWRPLVWVLAVLSLVVGSVLAVVQTDVKRMLAYSSISHASYVMIGLQAATDRGVAGSVYYLLVYTFMVMGSFAVVTVVSGRGDSRHGLGDFRGLSRTNPGLALAFAFFLLAQAGAPFTTGFLAKFGVIAAAVEARSYAVAVIAMLAAVVAAFLYLRIIVAMYMTDDEPVAGHDAVPEPAVATATSPGGLAGPIGEMSGAATLAVTMEPALAGHDDLDDDGRLEVPNTVGLVIGLALAVTLVAGLWAEPLLDLARHATLLRP